MSLTIKYYFAITSTWAFVGHDNFVALARRHGAAIDYRPLPLHDLFAATGGLPLPRRSKPRQAYRFLELKRWRRKLGLSFNLEPGHWPLHGSLADRAVLAILDQDLDPHPAISLFYKSIWQDERDLDDGRVVAELLRQSGYDDASVLRIAEEERIYSRYRANLEAALADGVFGAPSFVIDDELFWGQDRIEFIEEKLSTGLLVSNAE